MIEIKLQPKDCMYNYFGQTLEFRNFTQNRFTGLWTFDFYYPDGHLLGVPISTGTSIIKGNGTPIYKMVFLDLVSQDGDVTVPANTRLYLLEE